MQSRRLARKSALQRRDGLTKRIESGYYQLEKDQARRETAEALPRRERKDELRRIDSMEAISRRQLERLEAELGEMPAAGDAARREFAVADQVLAERRQLAITAARISPPPYITKELGERPSDPAKRKAWDRGVAHIERYCQEHGIKDPRRALGPETKQGAERARRQAATRRLQGAQRVLGLGQHAARVRQVGRGLGIGR